MSPEQVRGQESDSRSDIFSLGLMLYELLAGKPAFQAESAVEVMHAIVAEDPPELPESVPDGLRRIIKRCIEKKPAQRFQSARDLAFALRSFAGLTRFRARARGAVAASRPRRRWLWPVVGGLSVATAIVFAFLWLRPRPASGHLLVPVPSVCVHRGSGILGRLVARRPEHRVRRAIGARRPISWCNRSTLPRRRSSPPRPPSLNRSGRPTARGSTFWTSRDGVFAVSRAGGQPDADRRTVPSHFTFRAMARISRCGEWTAPRTDGQRCSVWISSPPGAEPVEYPHGPFGAHARSLPCICASHPTANSCIFRCTPTRARRCGCSHSPPEAGQPRRIFEKVPWNRPRSRVLDAR